MHILFVLTFIFLAIQINSRENIVNQPEPPGWFAGDIHTHKNCGGGSNPRTADAKLREGMAENDLSVLCVLANMGNGDPKYTSIDLRRVNGNDDSISYPGRIIHWGAEWHYDPDENHPHKVIGGHLVVLGIQEAHTMPVEYTGTVFQWAMKQNGITGFAHMQYLDNSIPQTLNCCIPVEYPVEVALGTCAFISEDVNGDDAAIEAYYKLLNCGFRPGLAAGTDYPCNGGAPFGTLLTYVQVKDKPLTYRNWIEGIANGRTVVSRDAHNEFFELTVNGTSTPGDQIYLTDNAVTAEIKCSATKELTGRVELICNGKVLATHAGTVKPNEPLILKTTQNFTKSGWLCDRRVDSNGHTSHTGAVYVIVNNAPIRASSDDALYFAEWIDNILEKIAPGGSRNSFFKNDMEAAQSRFKQAKDIYLKIAEEAKYVGN